MVKRRSAVALLVFVWVVCGAAFPGSPGKKQKVSGEVAVVDTNMGRITFRFFEKESPRTAKRFKDLARAGYFDETVVSRIMPGLLIQLGALEEGVTKPRPAVETLQVEASPLKHGRGTVSSIREMPAAEGGIGFFIALQAINYYDGRYTIFGEVISGMEVVNAISNVPRNMKAAPLFAVRIRKVSIETQDYFVGR